MPSLQTITRASLLNREPPLPFHASLRLRPIFESSSHRNKTSTAKRRSARPFRLFTYFLVASDQLAQRHNIFTDGAIYCQYRSQINTSKTRRYMTRSQRWQMSKNAMKPMLANAPPPSSSSVPHRRNSRLTFIISDLHSTSPYCFRIWQEVLEARKNGSVACRSSKLLIVWNPVFLSFAAANAVTGMM